MTGLAKVIAIGPEVRIKVTGLCPRCVMTTLAQGDLPKDSDSQDGGSP